jgi:hypothetical protein
VQRLPGVDDVQDPVGPQRADAVPDGGQIRCRVAEAAVRLAHDQRHGVAVGVADVVEEHAERAVAARRDAGPLEVVGHRRQRGVVEAFADDVSRRQPHAERRVDCGEVPRGLVDDPPPGGQGFAVAGLQRHDPPPRPLREPLVRVERHARRAVQLRQPRDAGGSVVRMLVEVLDEHSELRSPVPDVVLPHDRAAEPFEHPYQRVADDGRPQVADVHLLRDVGLRVVDDRRAARLGRGQPEPVRQPLGHQRQQRVVGDGEVDETGPGDGAAGENGVGCQFGRHRGGQFARVATHRTGEREDAVGLEVGVLGPADLRIGCGLGCGGAQSPGHPGGEGGRQ